MKGNSLQIGNIKFPVQKERIIRRNSEILSTASFFPERVVTNQEIIDANDLPITETVIQKTLGIARRRVVDPGSTDSDLLAQAAKLCLKKVNVRPDQLSKILVTKLLGDRLLPMTASLVQRKLGCNVSIHAIDIEGGINAFLHALDLATRYISTTAAETQYVLVLSGGIHQLPVSKIDPRLAFLFGDGAGAILIGASKRRHFLASYIYSNFRYYDQAGSPILKMDKSMSDQIYIHGNFHHLYNFYRMGNWKDSVDFYVEAALVIRERLLAESQLSMNDIDLVLVTENNRRIRDLTLEALEVPKEKSLTIIQDYANTMSAMLPILLDKGFTDGHLGEEGMHVMLISHGEGASGGGMVYRV